MPLRDFGAQFSLRTHLVLFGVLILIPVLVLAGLLLARSAALERQQLERRLNQVARDLAGDIDRGIASDITLLHTLATFDALATEDWQTFHGQAKAALQGQAYVLVIDTSLSQLVNTFVPFGSQPLKTGDPDTARRIMESKQPEVSNLFISLVAKKPVFNIDLPVLRDGEVQYILNLGRFAEELVPVLQAQQLGRDWVTAVLDRKGVVIARSSGQEQFAGKPDPAFAAGAAADRSPLRVVDYEGQEMLRAIASSPLSGWFVTAEVPLRMAEAPLRRSAWQWGGITALAVVLSAVLAWLLARALQRPMEAASQAALALGRGEPIVRSRSSLVEINTITDALEAAGTELSNRAAQQRLLLSELSHRVKNTLAVVQAVVVRTLSNERSMPLARDLLTQRIQSLGRAHDLLMKTEWEGASIHQIIEAELNPFSAQVLLDGPDLMVNARMVQTFALVLHELATNAAKYGSLAGGEGRVTISWGLSDDRSRFLFRWEERDGPRVQPPSTKGFGTALLESGLSTSSRPRLSFEAEGFVYEIDVPAAAILYLRVASDPGQSMTSRAS